MWKMRLWAMKSPCSAGLHGHPKRRSRGTWLEERYIVGNTGGTTPTIYLDSPLSFTPQAGDAYEILSGRLFTLGVDTVAAGIWKYYDIATNYFSGNLATANLRGPSAPTAASSAWTSPMGLTMRILTTHPFGQLIATASGANSIIRPGRER